MNREEELCSPACVAGCIPCNYICGWRAADQGEDGVGERGQSGMFLGGTLGDAGAGGGGVRDEPRVHSELPQNSALAWRPRGPASLARLPSLARLLPGPPRLCPAAAAVSTEHSLRLPTSTSIKPLPSLLCTTQHCTPCSPS